MPRIPPTIFGTVRERSVALLLRDACCAFVYFSVDGKVTRTAWVLPHPEEIFLRHIPAGERMQHILSGGWKEYADEPFKAQVPLF